MSTNRQLRVKKRSGELETFNAEKISEMVLEQCEGISGVSASEIIMNANLHLQDGMTTVEYQDTLIKSAAYMISEETPNYQIVAARLLNQKLRKDVYGQYQPKPFLETIKKNTKAGIYDPYILEQFTEEEIEYFGSKIKYSRDDTYTYAGLKQLAEKYLIRRNGKAVETPQEMNMLINMIIFAAYSDKAERRKWILEGYRALSTHEVSLPTPVMVGVRTTMRKFISCNIIDAGDTTNSLADAGAAVMKLTAARSGIGIHGGWIRGLGADIGGGRTTHTGAQPILKSYEKDTKAFTQESRGGSSTIYYPFFHTEIETILQLGNAKGTEESKVRHADHAMTFNKLLIERWLNDEEISLFYINDVPDLIELMGDNEKFKERYEYYEAKLPKKKIKTIKAKDLMDLFIDERFLQGRVYEMALDHTNEHGMWKIPIISSNLCTEITVPIKPIDMENGEFGEVGVCILAGKNIGHLKEEREEVVSEYLVRFLEAMIDFMDYSMKAVEFAARMRRTLGIGFSDIFHYMAKNKEFYNTQSGRDFLHRRIEMSSFYLIKASIKLAKELGPCPLIEDTKWVDGVLPIDNYCKNVDDLVSIGLEMPWEELRADLKKYGIRHSTIMAEAPYGNSSKPSNSTPGIEPPRQLVTVKDDNKVKVKQVVPDFVKYKNYYTTAWGDDFNNIDYFKFVAVMQKFIDQSISTNQYANLVKYEGKYPKDLLEKEYLTAYKYGLKTLYYQNFKNKDKEGLDDEPEEEKQSCGSGGCEV